MTERRRSDGTTERGWRADARHVIPFPSLRPSVIPLLLCLPVMPASPDRVVIRNARQHNLKGITVELPRRALTVITGPSGAGKSSLAFDTLYAEGQRRYIESLSTYAKQFL